MTASARFVDCLCMCAHVLHVTVSAGVQAQVAAVVLGHLDPLQQQLFDLQSGTLPGDWEGALELVGRIADALRKVRLSCWQCTAGSAASLLSAEH